MEFLGRLTATDLWDMHSYNKRLYSLNIDQRDRE